MFRFLVTASLRSRFVILMLAVALAGYGLFVQREIPVDIFPDLNKGLVTIMTESYGLAPEEVAASEYFDRVCTPCTSFTPGQAPADAHSQFNQT